MAEEDNFDIDIYGDETGQEGFNGDQPADENYNYDNNQEPNASHGAENSYEYQNGQDSNPTKPDTINSSMTTDDAASSTTLQPSSEPPPPQGVKRKGMDDRPVDPNSTNAVQVTELHWWVTEDDIRGWCANAGCEDEVKEITFNEHKVNGKSKGQVYIELASQGAATALKHHIDKLEARKSDPKAPVATYFHGPSNPYKTLPKDNARRNDQRGGDRNFSGQGSNFSGNSNFNSGGNFRGRGNFGGGNRGGMNMNFNRGGGFQGGQMAPMGGGPMSAPNMNMGPYGGMNSGGFQNFNRGGMMGGGMRGGMQPNRGRGGMGGPGPNMMGPMGGMNMGNMPMGGMGMTGGMMGMAGGFQNQGHFNPQFFQGHGANGGDWGNPHGAKRPRPNE